MIERWASEIAEHIFAGHAGVGERSSGAEAVRDLAAIFEKLERSMASALGEAGYHAMLARCIRRSKPRFALPATDAQIPSFDALATVLQRLKEEESRTVRAVGITLMTQFIELLGNLIGAELTSKLLNRTWPEAP